MSSIAGTTGRSPFEPHNFAMTHGWVYRIEGMEPADRDTYTALAMVADSTTGRFYLELADLAEFLQCSERTAIRRINRLVELGVLQRLHMWWMTGDKGQRILQSDKPVAHNQAASDFRLLRSPDGFPADAFTASVERQAVRSTKGTPCRREPVATPSGTLANSESPQGDTSVQTQGDISVRSVDTNVTHNREPQHTTQATETRDSVDAPRRPSLDDSAPGPIPATWQPNRSHVKVGTRHALHVTELASLFVRWAEVAKVNSGDWDAKFGRLLELITTEPGGLLSNPRGFDIADTLDLRVDWWEECRLNTLDIPDGQLEVEFAEWFETYPSNEGARLAVTLYSSVRRRGISRETLLAGAQRYAADPHRDPEFTTQPVNWLSHERWTDEPITTPAKTADLGWDQPFATALADDWIPPF